MINLSKQQLIKFQPKFKNIEDISFSNIEWLTNQCNEGTLLFYKLNHSDDVPRFIERIKKTNYAAVIVNSYFEEVEAIENLICLDDENFLNLMKYSCDLVYGNIDQIKKIAVTGTNGKTSVTHLISQLLQHYNKNVLSVGTLGFIYNLQSFGSFNLTTPNYIDLRKAITGKEIEYLVMEVSSHALKQNRINNLIFESAAFTNFSQDHLDYHVTMEDYLKSKLLLVNFLKDDGVFFTTKKLAINTTDQRTKIIEDFIEKVEVQKIFKQGFNRENLNFALNILDQFGFSFGEINFLTPVPGRMNIFENKNKTVILDFAHTPDAIENICKEVRKTYNQKEVVILFGCGGDRDRTKREPMGKAALAHADKVFITSDNPRSEDPSQIINDIVKNLNQNNIMIEVDRKKAIKKAMDTLNDNQVLIVAGKGHENYLEIKGEKIPYSDQQEIEKNL